MRAMRVAATNAAPELLDIDAPEPGKGEALIDIAACGLNFADLLMMKGQYQEKPAHPYTPGLEMAGIVRALGPETSGPEPGARVAAYIGQGGLAEAAALPVTSLVEVPDTMPLSVAAGFQVAYGTSHVALDHKARLQPGETLLVLGAAGGVGLTAVELGRIMGAKVIACAKGADKLAVAKEAGAHHLIDSEDGDLRDQVRALGGADVVYDAVGGDLFKAAFRATNPDGRILAIGFASGDVPQIPANILLVKNISVHGLYWGGYLKFRPEVLTRSLTQLFDWYKEGRISPHIGHIVPLEAAAEGLELLRSRKSTGKVVVQINQSLQ